MRFRIPFLLGAAALTVAASADVEFENDADVDLDDDAPPGDTYFNYIKVPPLLELTPDNWKTEATASKWLMVKFYKYFSLRLEEEDDADDSFSPYCLHCIDYAPTYQTLYEFYYTSSPLGSGNEDANFTRFYDFRFALINCVAYFDMCASHNIGSYPTTVLYKDGEPVKTLKGVKDMKTLSLVVEDALEKTKPGSRPAKLEVPMPDEDEFLGPISRSGKKSGSAMVVQGKIDEEPGKATNSKPGSRAKENVEKESEKAKIRPDVSTDGKTKSDSTPYKAPPKKAAEISPNANQHGVSVSLTAEGFQELVTTRREPWLVKFYAPWCQHCQALAPVWEQVAKAMKGKLNVGEVNCVVESRLCKDVQVQGYPTILFFRGGDHVEYQGLRGLGDFVQYAEKAIDISSGVQDVDAVSFAELESKEEVIFAYFYDHATTSEDFMALERLTLSLVGHAKLVKTRDPTLYERFKITTWPRLLVSREGRPTYYPPLTPKEMRDTRQVLDWMKSVWLPIVPEMTASNAREIMGHKIVVLGILNREERDSFVSAKREMKSAASEWMDKQIQLFQLERQELRDAKQLRIEEAEDRGDQRGLRNAKSIRIDMNRSDRKEVTFAWVDGVFWQRWLRNTYGIEARDGDRVIINDEDSRRYWDQTSTGNYIVPSRTSILETLNKVTAQPPKIQPKLSIGPIEKILFDIHMTVSEHPYLSAGCFFGLALGLASWFRGRYRNVHGHFRLDDSTRDFKVPLLGGNMNGKTD